MTGVAAGITGGEVSYRFLDPYGDPLPTGSSLTGEKPGVLSGSSAARRAWPATHGFVGGTTDPDTTTGAVPTGLTQLGARPYDPETGAFTATDPVIDTTHPAQLTGVYAYAWHTPLTATDPAGTEPYPWHNKNPTPAQKAQFKNYNAYGYSDKQKNNVARGLRPNGQGRSSGRPQTAGGERGWEATANRYEAQARAHNATRGGRYLGAPAVVSGSAAAAGDAARKTYDQGRRALFQARQNYHRVRAQNRYPRRSDLIAAEEAIAETRWAKGKGLARAGRGGGIAGGVLTLGATYLTYVNYKYNEDMTQTEAVIATGVVTIASVGGNAAGAAIGMGCGPLALACVPMLSWAGGVGMGLAGEAVVSVWPSPVEWAARRWDDHVPPVGQ